MLLVEGSYIDAVIREPVPVDATTDHTNCNNQSFQSPVGFLRTLEMAECPTIDWNCRHLHSGTQVYTSGQKNLHV